MFDCHFLESYSQKKRGKKGPSLAYWFEQSMESRDSTDEEAPPSNPNRKDLMRKEWSKAVSMLVDMKTEHSNSLRRGAIIIIAKNLAWHTAQSIIYGREQKACMSWV